MLGLGNNLYQVPSSSSVSINSKEERFDYEDSESDENDDSGISLGRIRIEQGFNFRSFIDQINAKTKALAMARELDAERGIRHADATGSAGSIDTTTSTSTDVGRAQDDGFPKTSIRRIPSGARPSTSEPNLETSTPMKSAPQDTDSRSQTISDLLVQSTPLAAVRSMQMNKNPQPKDLLKERLIETHKNQADGDEDFFTSELNNHLQAEISNLKKEIESYQSAQSEKDEKFKRIEQLLKDTEEEMEKMRKDRDGQEEAISLLERQINEHREYIDLLQNNKQDGIEQYQQTLERLEKEMEQATRELDGNRTLEEKLKQVTEDFTSEKAKSHVIISDLQKSLDETRESVVSYTSTIEDLTKRNDLISMEVESKTSNMRQLELELTQIKALLEQQEKKQEEQRSKDKLQISTLTANNESLQSECNNLKMHVSMLEKQHSEHENLRDSLEQTNSGMANVIETLKRTSQEQHETITKLEAGTEERWRKEMDTISHFKTQCEELRMKYENAQDEMHKTQYQLEESKASNNDLTEFLKNLSLFQIHIGGLILDNYQRSKFESSLDAGFIRANCDVTGFQTRQQVDELEKLKQEFANVTKELETLNNEIENDWKPKTQLLEEKQSILINENETIRGNVGDRDGTISKLQTTIDDLNGKLLLVTSEKESLSRDNMVLNEQNNRMERRLEIEVNQASDLSAKIEELTSEQSLLCQNLTETKTKLEEERHLIREKDELLNKQKLKATELQSELSKLQQQIIKIEGKTSKKITFQIASQSHPHLSKKVYDALMVDVVNGLNMVELQNVVKNMILLLEIPLSKLTKKIPLVSIYLRYEKSLCLHFANRLHHLIFHEAIDIKRYTSIAYGQYQEHHDICHLQHPLENCLDNLYKEVSSRLLLSP